MATIEKKANGTWQARIRRKGQPVQSATYEYKDDAEAWARDVENKMDRGIFADRSDAEEMTVGELVDLFVKEFAPSHYRVREDKKEAWRFQCGHIKDALGQYSLASLDQKIIKKYRDARQKPVIKTYKSGMKKEVVAGGSTVRKELYMLSKIIGYAEKELEIMLPKGNPVLKVRMPADGKARDRRLAEKEWVKLEVECRASRNIYLWAAVELAVESSTRQGELLFAKWKNVDLIKGTIHLPKTKNGEARTVPLSPRAVVILKGLPRSISGAVIPVERMTLYHAFKAAVARAGIEDFTFHDLRHEGLSRLAERGDFSLLEMAAVSGHKTLQVLKKHYIHLDAENLAKKLGQKR